MGAAACTPPPSLPGRRRLALGGWPELGFGPRLPLMKLLAVICKAVPQLELQLHIQLNVLQVEGSAGTLWENKP